MGPNLRASPYPALNGGAQVTVFPFQMLLSTNAIQLEHIQISKNAPHPLSFDKLRTSGSSISFLKILTQIFIPVQISGGFRRLSWCVQVVVRSS